MTESGTRIATTTTTRTETTTTNWTRSRTSVERKEESHCLRGWESKRKSPHTYTKVVSNKMIFTANLRGLGQSWIFSLFLFDYKKGLSNHRSPVRRQYEDSLNSKLSRKDHQLRTNCIRKRSGLATAASDSMPTFEHFPMREIMKAGDNDHANRRREEDQDDVDDDYCAELEQVRVRRISLLSEEKCRYKHHFNISCSHFSLTTF